LKLVDEKGRLFGLLNVIDLAVLVMVIVLGAGLFVKVVLPRLADEESKLRDVYITVVSRGRPEGAALELMNNPGAPLVAKNDFVDGEIVSASYTPSVNIGYDEFGNAVITEHPYNVDITVVIKGQADPEAAVFTVGTQEMRIGYTIYVKTQRVEIVGVIEGIEFPGE